MTRLGRSSAKNDSPRLQHRCNHSLAVVIDATERDLRELEQMLAECPNCSRWVPGDGPIMATASTREATRDGLDFVSEFDRHSSADGLRTRD